MIYKVTVDIKKKDSIYWNCAWDNYILYAGEELSEYIEANGIADSRNESSDWAVYFGNIATEDNAIDLEDYLRENNKALISPFNQQGIEECRIYFDAIYDDAGASIAIVE